MNRLQRETGWVRPQGTTQKSKGWRAQWSLIQTDTNPGKEQEYLDTNLHRYAMHGSTAPVNSILDLTRHRGLHLLGTRLPLGHSSIVEGEDGFGGLAVAQCVVTERVAEDEDEPSTHCACWVGVSGFGGTARRCWEEVVMLDRMR